MIGRRSAVLLACSVVCAAGTARADDGGPPAPSTGVVVHDVLRTAPPDGQSISAVAIDNRLGDVEVEGHDDNQIVIIAVKRAPDDETIERLRVSVVPDPRGKVSISTALKATGREARPVAAGSVRVDLIVRAPRAARVDAVLWNGHVAVKSVENGARLTVNDGNIDVRQVSGPIRASAARGRQRFLDIVGGSIDAQIVTGDMNLDTVAGEFVDASVHQGRVVGRRVRVRRMFVRTTRGDIRIEGEALAGGRYLFGAMHGDVEVKLAAASGLRMRARARDNNIALPTALRRGPMKRGYLTGVYGKGKDAAEVVMDARDGKIALVVMDWD